MISLNLPNYDLQQIHYDLIIKILASTHFQIFEEGSKITVGIADCYVFMELSGEYFCHLRVVSKVEPKHINKTWKFKYKMTAEDEFSEFEGVVSQQTLLLVREESNGKYYIF